MNMIKWKSRTNMIRMEVKHEYDDKQSSLPQDKRKISAHIQSPVTIGHCHRPHLFWHGTDRYLREKNEGRKEKRKEGEKEAKEGMKEANQGRKEVTQSKKPRKEESQGRKEG